MGGDGGRARRRVGAPGRRGGFGAGDVGHRRDAHRGALGEQARHRGALQGRLPGSIRCCVSATTATRSLPCCVPATPRRTASPTTSNCLTRRSVNSPPLLARGTTVGDDAADAARPLRVRGVDSAGCSVHIAQACRDRNVGFSLVAMRANDARSTPPSPSPAVEPTPTAWQGAIRQNGDSRRGAAVADLTDLVDTDDWPPGTRLIVRREPRHAGYAQRSLFPSDAYRYWGHPPGPTRSRRRRRPRRAHARPRPRRRPHQKTQILRTHPHALQQPRPPTPPGSRSCVGRTTSSAGSNNSAAPTPSPPPRRNGSAGRCGTPPPASSAPGDATPSAYPPTTPAQHTSPASTTTSPPSAEHPTRRHKNITTATTNHPAGPPHAPPHQPQTRNNTPTAPNP